MNGILVGLIRSLKQEGNKFGRDLLLTFFYPFHFQCSGPKPWQISQADCFDRIQADRMAMTLYKYVLVLCSDAMTFRQRRGGRSFHLYSSSRYLSGSGRDGCID